MNEVMASEKLRPSFWNFLLTGVEKSLEEEGTEAPPSDLWWDLMRTVSSSVVVVVVVVRLDVQHSNAAAILDSDLFERIIECE